jgi:DNA repair protein RadC
MPFEHPGGKLRELGAESLTDQEILSILISSGTNGFSAEDIANDLIKKYGSIAGMAGEPLENFLRIKGLGDVKITRIAAAFELARRAAFYFDRDPQISLPIDSFLPSR